MWNILMKAGKTAMAHTTTETRRFLLRGYATKGIGQMSSEREEAWGKLVLAHEQRNGHVPKLPGSVQPLTNVVDTLVDVMGATAMTTRQIADVLGWTIEKSHYYAQRAVMTNRITRTGCGKSVTYQKATS
jgi:hypothetical protein